VAVQQANTAREGELIAQHIDADWGIDDARVRGAGAPVWALVAYLEAAQGRSEQVAHDYGLTPEQLEAALAFYRRHKTVIDARILLNEA
jgi:uncharacterized protein (DUF433 family)